MFRLLLSGRLRISKGRTDVMHCSEGRSRDVWRSPRTCPDCLLLPMADGKRFFYFAFSGNGNTRDATVHSREALESIPDIRDPVSMGLC